MANTPKAVIKTIKDLNIAMKETIVDLQAIGKSLDKGSPEVLNKTLDRLSKIKDKNVDINAIQNEIKKNIEKWYKGYEDIGYIQQALELGIKTMLDHELKITEEKRKQAKLEENAVKFARQVGKAMDHIVKSNEEIYKTSHKMQLEGNITWREFTKLYDGAYSSARKLNQEIGKQLFAARELVGVQEKLITQGFKGLDSTTLSEVSASMSMLFRTMGNVDDRLIKAFEGSYKMFDDSTGIFIKSLGDRLNNFSDSFGMTVSMLQGTVAEMMAANTFLARNNMQAQLRANESLMQAAALTTQIGVTSPHFINQLAKTAQFGTASQMAGIFQTGALLQGFSTMDFQNKMLSSDYFGATEDLIGSIYGTLSSMEPGYLRNEFMQRIGEGFGLSQDDLLNIMTHGGNLDEYTIEIQEKLAESQGSMEKELADLHITIKDRLENLWENTGLAQGMGKVFNELGLYGLVPQLSIITAGVTKLAFQGTISNLFGGVSSSTSGLGGTGSISGTSALGRASSNWGVMPAIGKVGAGLAVGYAGHTLGESVQQNLQTGDTLANIGGGLLKVGSGVASGAMIGSAFPGYGTLIGGIVGGLAGLGDAIFGGIKRNQAQEELALQERDKKILESRESLKGSGQSPEIDAINNVAYEIRKFRAEVTDNQLAGQSLSITLNTKDIVDPSKGK